MTIALYLSLLFAPSLTAEQARPTLRHPHDTALRVVVAIVTDGSHGAHLPGNAGGRSCGSSFVDEEDSSDDEFTDTGPSFWGLELLGHEGCASLPSQRGLASRLPSCLLHLRC